MADRVTVVFVGWVALQLVASSLATITKRPNIIFIVADDLVGACRCRWTIVRVETRVNLSVICVFDVQGWDDISFHGSEQIPTPAIDELATSGVMLNNYYVQPICTPTRSCFMTGRHPIHTGMQSGVIMGQAPYGLGLDEKLLPQYLQELGYSTHAIGKVDYCILIDIYFSRIYFQHLNESRNLKHTKMKCLVMNLCC